jgi:putative multiple sugar transport system permease protein
MLIALIAISLFFEILTGGVIFRPMNLTKLIMQNSYVLILAIGMLPCILTGNVDLSVGSVLALISAICGKLIVVQKLPVPAAIPIALICGLIIGAFQAVFIAYIRIPAFIVTLAGMLIFRGFSMVILNGRTFSPFPTSYSWIAAGFFPRIPFAGSDLIALAFALICVLILIASQMRERSRQIGYQFKVDPFALYILRLILLSGIILFLAYWVGSYNGLSGVTILLVVLILIYRFITENTVVGRHIYAFGGNERAAKLSGINTNFVLFAAFVNSAFIAAIAGIVFSGRLNAATPTAGSGFELDAIAACYIGGASVTGGVGTVMGAVIGGLVMGILNNGMSIMGIGSDWQQVIKGLVLLLAVTFDILGKKK